MFIQMLLMGEPTADSPTPEARGEAAMNILVPNDARRMHAVEILVPNDARRMHAVKIHTGTGNITPQFKEALKECRFKAFWGDNASVQPGCGEGRPPQRVTDCTI